MAKKKDTLYSPNGKIEKSILSALKEITKSDAESYFILFKYAPELIPADNIKTFEDLKSNYATFEGRTEQSLEKSLFREDVQKAIKYLLKRLDGKRDIELLNKYYNLSMSGDVQALKSYLDFKKKYFADNEADELKSILKGVTIKNDDDEDDDFEMKL